jgi:hypothetical protein
MSAHYVYRVTRTDTGEFYIGCRTPRGSPSKDISYKGTGGWPRQMLKSGVSLTKKIIRIFDNLSEARTFERTLIQSHKGNHLCRNRQHCGRRSDNHVPTPHKPLMSYIRSRGLTVQNFANLVEVTPATVIKWLTCMAIPGQKTALKIVEATKGIVTIRDIYG